MRCVTNSHLSWLSSLLQPPDISIVANGVFAGDILCHGYQHPHRAHNEAWREDLSGRVRQEPRYQVMWFFFRLSIVKVCKTGCYRKPCGPVCRLSFSSSRPFLHSTLVFFNFFASFIVVTRVAFLTGSRCILDSHTPQSALDLWRSRLGSFLRWSLWC